MSSKLSLMPNISIPRSRFNQEFNHSFDMFHGDVVPVDCFEVVPGDEFSYTLSSLIRMSTPAVPVMGNIKCFIHGFFVPLRLLWNNAEKFYGDPSNHDTVSSITPVNFDTVSVPNLLEAYDTTQNTGMYPGSKFMYSVSDYLGKPDMYDAYGICSSAGALISWSTYKSKVNVVPFKELAYLQIWNDHFRPSSMVPPVLINKTGAFTMTGLGSETFTTGSINYLRFPFKCLPGFKQYDYYTASTFQPQFNSTTVKLPLGMTAPVMVDNTATGATGITAGSNVITPAVAAGSVSANPLTVYNHTLEAKVYADLSLATAASWNDIRYAAQLQKYFERSNYGNRYFEILNAHYGITNPDSRLQRAERLGSHSFYINISQVVSTADTENGGTGQNLGNTGAVSSTGDKIHLFTKSFSEPGYVMIVMTTKYDRSYSSGFLREDLKKNRFEFYSPEFANLGDQSTKKLELQVMQSATAVTDPDQVFGYNEHWAEYRYRKDLVSGSLRVGKSSDFWTLADSFDSQSLTLGYDFLKEDRAALSRLLATGSGGPDYIVDTRAHILATRELPLYSIPGLIDHFGAL